MNFFLGNLCLPLIFISLAVEAKGENAILECMDTKGRDNKFIIFKENLKVQSYLDKGGPIGSYRETPTEYFFSFPQTAERSEALAKFNRNTGTLEFETGKLPYLSILWTANCIEIPHTKRF